MQVNLFLLVAGLFLTTPTSAACNTVMGGCAKEDTVNVSPHMKSEYVAKTKTIKPAASLSATNKAPSKSKANTNIASTAQKNVQ